MGGSVGWDVTGAGVATVQVSPTQTKPSQQGRFFEPLAVEPQPPSVVGADDLPLVHVGGSWRRYWVWSALLAAVPRKDGSAEVLAAAMRRTAYRQTWEIIMAAEG